MGVRPLGTREAWITGKLMRSQLQQYEIYYKSYGNFIEETFNKVREKN